MMNDKTLSYIIGLVSGGITYFWQNLLTAGIVAIVCGFLSWGTKELLDYAKMKIQQKKLRNEEH